MGASFDVCAISGRGNGLVASRPIQAGEDVLVETPLLLTVGPDASMAVCTTCLRCLGGSAEACTTCSNFAFCGPLCRDVAVQRPDVHAPWLCRTLALLQTTGQEERSAAHFLLQVCALQLAADGDTESRARLAALTGLAAAMGPIDDSPSTPSSAYNAAAAACGGQLPISSGDAARLLALEQRTSYGVMAPSAEAGHRRIRGSAFYATASLLNHECLPNVARFDDFDGVAASPGNTVARFRTLHAVPAGEELTQSYFPLVWDLHERAAACQEQYDFDCCCPRCKVEVTWEDEDDQSMSDGGSDIDDTAAGSSSEGALAKPDAELAGDSATGITEGYINMFLMKFVCPKAECFGTMAPAGPASETLQCSMCNHYRTEAQFLAEMGAA